MKKMRWVRILALCLSIACLVAAVGAANLSWDLNEDGKTNVWDLQLAVNQGKTAEEKQAALEEALGGKDELHPNADGVWEIYSSLGLYNMASVDTSGQTFKLMNDIDMKDAAWTPVSNFAGTFEGNGYTISNVSITKDVIVNTASLQGFFGRLGRGSLVKDLNLENVFITATEEAQYIGLLAGSSVGDVENCTTTGKVIDDRTTLTGNVYIGTLVGRVENVSDTGTITIEKTLTATAGSGVAGDEGTPVVSKMAMDFADLTFAEGATTYKRVTGIAGYAPDYTSIKNYNWQDISGSTDLIDPILEDRRQTVVDKMYEICTVEWTPSQDMTIYYYKTGTGENAGKLNYSTVTWTAGKVYRGMPYNHGSGSLERFMEWMDAGTTTDYKTKTSLPTEAYYYTYSALRTAMSNYTDTTLQTAFEFTDPNTGTTYDILPAYQLADQPMIVGETVNSADHAGFSRYIGNDCSSAIQWAWRSVISSDVKNGGTVISGVTQMTPTTTYQTRHGVQPVGGLVPTGTDVTPWEEYAAAMGQNAFFDAYAQASKGDALIMFNTAGGHSRMIAYDPICIRNYKGVIDANNSYIITHEQGRSSSGAEGGVSWNSTCYVNCLYTFDQLYNYENHLSGIGSRGYYMPMTLPAFHDVNSKAVSSTVTVSGTTIKSNFYIVSTTVDGNEVFTAIGQHNNITPDNTWVGTGYREAQVQVDAAATHGDLTGKTVTVLLSNGDTYSVNVSAGTATKTN